MKYIKIFAFAAICAIKSVLYEFELTEAGTLAFVNKRDGDRQDVVILNIFTRRYTIMSLVARGEKPVRRFDLTDTEFGISDPEQVRTYNEAVKALMDAFQPTGIFGSAEYVQIPQMQRIGQLVQGIDPKHPSESITQQLKRLTPRPSYQ